MSKKTEVNLNDLILNKLSKSFKKGKVPKIKIGILGDGGVRDDEKSNATIGTYHEFGKGNNPIRSFLRMPLTEKFEPALKKSGFTNKKAIEKALKENDLEVFMSMIAVVAESVILEAFDTGGFGKWPASNMDHKKNKQTLVETQQLMKSIDWELV